MTIPRLPLVCDTAGFVTRSVGKAFEGGANQLPPIFPVVNAPAPGPAPEQSAPRKVAERADYSNPFAMPAKPVPRKVTAREAYAQMIASAGNLGAAGSVWQGFPKGQKLS